MTWSPWFELTSTSVANETPTTCGVFCIARKSSSVTYPDGASSTVMLGVAADRQKGLRAVLGEIAKGKREDLERQRQFDGGLKFCFQGNLGNSAADLHSKILADFVSKHGAAPCCNPGGAQ